MFFFLFFKTELFVWFFVEDSVAKRGYHLINSCAFAGF